MYVYDILNNFVCCLTPELLSEIGFCIPCRNKKNLDQELIFTNNNNSENNTFFFSKILFWPIRFPPN